MAIMRTMQPSFTAGELSPALWARVDLAKYASGLKIAKNIFIHPHGGASNRAGFQFVAETRGSGIARQIPFIFDAATNQTYDLVFTDLKLRIYRAGSPILNTAKTITGITKANPGVVTSAAHGYANGQEIVVTGIAGMTELNGRNFIVANVTTNTFTLKDMYGVADDTTNYTAYSSAGSARSLYEVTSPYAEADIGNLVVAQDKDVMFITHVKYAPRKLSRLADDNWTIGTVTFAPTLAAPSAPTVTTPGDTSGDTGYTPTAYYYSIAVISSANGDESLPSPATGVTNDLDLAGGINRISWSAVSGASRYIVYKYDNGLAGYIGATTALQFDDENITADLAQAPQEANNPFAGAGDYPRCVTFFEQRLGFAGSENNPSAVWLGQTGNYENFGSATPATASDAIIFSIRSREKNEIRGIVPLRGLGVFTSAAEWMVTGGSQDFISPSQIVTRPQSYRGMAYVQPVVVGNVVLFPQSRGGVIRDFSYDFATDAFTGSDLTILARHLFEGRSIKAWAYAQSPHSIVWTVLDDGSLVSLTYMREHEVWAWTRHETDGTFEDVTVLPEGDEDVPYLIVKRTINGQTKRYIERLHTREFSSASGAFFVDSGLSYEGSPVTTVRGLYHLEGKTVSVLADGNVVKGLVVTDGAITLPNAASTVHAGLGYEALLKTLDIDLGMVKGLGTVQGRYKSVGEVTLRVEDTRGIFVGPREDRLTEWKQRQYENWDAAIDLFTGDFSITPTGDWTRGGTVFIKQTDPLPMTILAILPDLALGG